MADSFFGFDTSLSNLDDEGGGGPSEDEYDALNDETFGQDSAGLDWEVEHEQLASQLEGSRRRDADDAHDAHASLEASLSQLVLDETDSVRVRSLDSSVWRHDLPTAPTPVPGLKNVRTVEELERQLRLHQQPNNTHNFYQPRFPPVILQRPPGLQAPVPLPFAPQQNVPHNMSQMTQSLNNIIGQNNQMGQNNIMGQMGQNANQLGQNVNQMGPNVNQMGPNVNQMGQNVNQFMQNVNQMNNFQNNMMNMQQNMQVHQMNQLSQNQMGQNLQMGQSMNQMGQNVNQMGQNVNQMGQNVNQMGQNVNQMGQNVNQIMQNGNQFNPGLNQFQHMMNQPRMMAPPPGMNMPRPGQNFNQNMGQFNPNFRGPTMPGKNEPLNQQNMLMNQQIKHQSTQINQKNQPEQLSPQKGQQKMPTQPQQQQQKIQQKSRVYNNSKNNQNMSSQNLVQLIQNTHPMLQFNNSFHNASHHPMLNNRQSYINSYNNQSLMNNLRQNGNYGNSNRDMNGSDASSHSDCDEYAGLMTSREKQWLINIQMLQLSSGTPYIHDFYYTVFLERKASKEKGMKEAHKANQQNHPFYNNSEGRERERERHNSARLNSDDTPRTYAPAQFENSLGKLQCGSVTAPRKIIDVEVVGGDSAPRAAAPTPAPAPNDIPRDIRRTKQLLLDIEALYLLLLRLEELNDPLAIANALILKEREEKARQAESAAASRADGDDTNVFLRHIEAVQRRTPPAQHDKRQVVSLEAASLPSSNNKSILDCDRGQLCSQLWAGLLHERLQAMLAVRKGRTLITRFLSRVGCSGAEAGKARALFTRVLRALPTASRRDPASLAPLAQYFAQYISGCSWAGVLEAAALVAEALEGPRPHALATPLTLSCVCSLIEKAAILVNTPEATSSERQWFKFLKSLARTLKNTTATVAKPVTPLAESKLRQHLKQLESRTTIEILQRGKTAEFADLTKNDVLEYLTKYLC